MIWIHYEFAFVVVIVAVAANLSAAMCEITAAACLQLGASAIQIH